MLSWLSLSNEKPPSLSSTPKSLPLIGRAMLI
jgi:hypothetical protein